MKVDRYALVPISCVFFLQACADGDAPVTATPMTTVTATPTPTPAATAYQSAFDFTHDRSFTGLVTASTTQTIPAQLTYGDFDAGTIAYTAATQTLSAFGMTIVPNMMGAKLTTTDTSLAYAYTIGTSGALLTVYRASADATYVSYIRDDETVKPIAVTRFALIGAPTLPTELPLATTTYRLTVAQIGTAPSGQTLVIDAGGTRIRGTVSITMTGSSTPVSVNFQGISNVTTGRFDGSTSTTDGAYTGAFHGRLYGPAGIEIGLIVDLLDRNGNDATGIIVGRAG